MSNRLPTITEHNMRFLIIVFHCDLEEVEVTGSKLASFPAVLGTYAPPIGYLTQESWVGVVLERYLGFVPV